MSLSRIRTVLSAVQKRLFSSSADQAATTPLIHGQFRPSKAPPDVANLAPSGNVGATGHESIKAAEEAGGNGSKTHSASSSLKRASGASHAANRSNGSKANGNRFTVRGTGAAAPSRQEYIQKSFRQGNGEVRQQRDPGLERLFYSLNKAIMLNRSNAVVDKWKDHGGKRLGAVLDLMNKEERARYESMVDDKLATIRSVKNRELKAALTPWREGFGVVDAHIQQRNMALATDLWNELLDLHQNQLKSLQTMRTFGQKLRNIAFNMPHPSEYPAFGRLLSSTRTFIAQKDDKHELNKSVISKIFERPMEQLAMAGDWSSFLRLHAELEYYGAQPPSKSSVEALIEKVRQAEMEQKKEARHVLMQHIFSDWEPRKDYAATSPQPSNKLWRRPKHQYQQRKATEAILQTNIDTDPTATVANASASSTTDTPSSKPSPPQL